MCFLARKVSWQEPLLFKTSGSQTDPLSLEHFVAQHSKAAPQMPRNPIEKELGGATGPGTQVVSGATVTMGWGRLRSPHIEI